MSQNAHKSKFRTHTSTDRPTHTTWRSSLRIASIVIFACSSRKGCDIIFIRDRNVAMLAASAAQGGAIGGHVLRHSKFNALSVSFVEAGVGACGGGAVSACTCESRLRLNRDNLHRDLFYTIHFMGLVSCSYPREEEEEAYTSDVWRLT